MIKKKKKKKFIANCNYGRKKKKKVHTCVVLFASVITQQVKWVSRGDEAKLANMSSSIQFTFGQTKEKTK
jgi:hypothetical protein